MEFQCGRELADQAPLGIVAVGFVVDNLDRYRLGGDQVIPSTKTNLDDTSK
jgi:hypothetical protein